VNDQAEGLRQLVKKIKANKKKFENDVPPKKVLDFTNRQIQRLTRILDKQGQLTVEPKVGQTSKTLLVSSGKGGTGKSTVALFLSDFIFQRGYKVILVDLDITGANLHIMLSENFFPTISEYIRGKVAPDRLAHRTSQGFNFIQGVQEGFKYEFLNKDARVFKIIRLVKILKHKFDFVILDTATGINSLNLELLNLIDSLIVVTLSDNLSISKNYKFIQEVFNFYKGKYFLILNNLSNKRFSDEKDIENMSGDLNRFSNVSAYFTGTIPYESTISLNLKDNTSILNINSKLLNKKVESIIDKLFLYLNIDKERKLEYGRIQKSNF